MNTQSLKVAALATALTAFTAGCATYTGQTNDPNDPNRTQRGALIGAAIGAAAGLLSGDSAVERRQRAMVVAGVGALAGGAVGAYQDRQEADLRRATAGTGVDVTRDGDVIKVVGFDTLAGEPVTMDADIVVLATAIRPRPGIKDLAQKLSISYDKHGFLNEAHPKLRPVETNTAGVFLAGACQAPRDIPDTVATASSTAAKVLALFSQESLEREPTVARVDISHCAGCFTCERVCPYGAIGHREIRDRQGRLIKTVADVNPGVCQGCGTCQATCPSKSVELMGFTDEQIFAEVNAILA